MGYAHGPRETIQEPLNNIVRITMGALACYFGGLQELRCASFDEAINVPSDEAVKLAIRTQQILSHEYGITHTIDPLGGSYYVEALSDRMEADISKLMERVDSLGGAVRAIERQYIQSVITDGAIRRQRAFERKERVSVGQNLFATKAELPGTTFRIEPNVEREQIERLQKVKRERNDNTVREALAELETSARHGTNLMLPILAAVRAYATVGEICGILKCIFGEYGIDTSF
jgi:methylmalonyl-CoA mutase N-terminal domain/subunit